MISKTVTVQHDEQGEAFITLDDEILEAAGLQEGDTVVWEQINENSWALKKKE